MNKRPVLHVTAAEHELIAKAACADNCMKILKDLAVTFELRKIGLTDDEIQILRQDGDVPMVTEPSVSQRITYEIRP